MKLYLILLMSMCLTAFARNEQKGDVQVQRHIRFWAGQMKEHAEFAANFAHDPALKKQGLELSKRAQDAQNANGADFLQLCSDLKSYQNKVYSDVKKHEEANNNIKLDLLDHMNKETDYAQKKAQGKRLTQDEEARFWSEEHQGQAKAIAHFMKPNGMPLKQEAEQLEKSLNQPYMRATDKKMGTIEQANQEIDTIGAQLEKDPSKTQMPQKLAAHEKRERAYAREQLRGHKQLQTKSNRVRK